MAEEAMTLLLGDHNLAFQFAGLTLSFGVGPGNYCDNHHKEPPHADGFTDKLVRHVTTTFEVALWGPGPQRAPGDAARNYLRIGSNDDVAGWVPISKLPAIMRAFTTEDCTDEDKRQMIAFICNRIHSEGATSL